MIKGIEKSELRPLFQKESKTEEKSYLSKAGSLLYAGVTKPIYAAGKLFSYAQKTLEVVSPKNFPEWFVAYQVFAQVDKAKTDGVKCATYIPFSALLAHGPTAMYNDLVKDKSWSYFLSLSMEKRQSFIYDLYSKANSLASSASGPKVILENMKSFTGSLNLNSLSKVMGNLSQTNPELYNKALAMTKEGLVEKLKESTDKLATKLGSTEAASTLLSSLSEKINKAQSFLSLQTAIEESSQTIDVSDVQKIVSNLTEEREGFIYSVFNYVYDFLTHNEREAFQLEATASCYDVAADYYYALFFLGILTSLVGFRVFANYFRDKPQVSEDTVTKEQFEMAMTNFQANIQDLMANLKSQQDEKLDHIQKRLNLKVPVEKTHKTSKIERDAIRLALLQQIQAKKLEIFQRNLNTATIREK